METVVVRARRTTDWRVIRSRLKSYIWLLPARSNGVRGGKKKRNRNPSGRNKTSRQNGASYGTDFVFAIKKTNKYERERIRPRWFSHPSVSPNRVYSWALPQCGKGGHDKGDKKWPRLWRNIRRNTEIFATKSANMRWNMSSLSRLLSLSFFLSLSLSLSRSVRFCETFFFIYGRPEWRYISSHHR